MNLSPLFVPVRLFGGTSLHHSYHHHHTAVSILMQELYGDAQKLSEWRAASKDAQADKLLQQIEANLISLPAVKTFAFKVRFCMLLMGAAKTRNDTNAFLERAREAMSLDLDEGMVLPPELVETVNLERAWIAHELSKLWIQPNQQLLTLEELVDSLQLAMDYHSDHPVYYEFYKLRLPTALPVGIVQPEPVLLDFRPIRLHLLVERADLKWQKSHWLAAQRAADEATELAGELLRVQATYSQRMRNQMERDGARAHSLRARSLSRRSNFNGEDLRNWVGKEIQFSMLTALDHMHSDNSYQELHDRIFKRPPQDLKIELYKIFDYGKCKSAAEARKCYQKNSLKQHPGMDPPGKLVECIFSRPLGILCAHLTHSYP